MKTLVLAFSGGLDTSFCVPHLAAQGWAVHTVYVDTGGSTEADRAAIAAQAGAVGAVSHQSIDARQAVFDRFVRYLIQGNVLRGEVYPLSVAAERTQQAISVIEAARRVGASAVAHGSTGAGNDQVRFDIAFRVLAPELDIVTPIRDEAITRDKAIAYLESPSLPVPPKAGAYSINRGLWGTTWGGGWTHDTWAGPPAELLNPPADAPSPREIVIAWEQGIPVALDGVRLAGPELIRLLGDMGETYGFGRNIHVGETALGIKGRIGFEAGAALLLIAGASGAGEAGADQVADLLEGSARPLLRRPAARGALLRSRPAGHRSADRQQSAAGHRRDPGPARARTASRSSAPAVPFSMMDRTVATYGEENRLWTGEEARAFSPGIGDPGAAGEQSGG